MSHRYIKGLNICRLYTLDILVIGRMTKTSGGGCTETDAQLGMIKNALLFFVHLFM